MNILVKFPTYKRPVKFFNTLHEYYKKAKNYNKMHFVITIDDDDDSMCSAEVQRGFSSYPNITVQSGISISKIHAINRDINNIDYDWDVLLQASDDMIPIVDGYDQIIRNNMTSCYADLDGVLWFNDGHQKDNLNTLCILGKKYYNRFNYVYYPEYKSTWCDNEFTCVANILQKQTYFNETIIQHQHPDAGFGYNDIIHIKNKENEQYDMNLFLERKRNNFYIV